jgi:hypothetical protein
MKSPTKSETATRPSATDTLVNIAGIVLKFRGEEKPNLATVARVTNRASGLLRIKDLDERMENRERTARSDELTAN